MKQEERQNINEEENKNQVKNSGQDTNRIMGLAAIFISILSMTAVIYQSYLAREENELIRIQQSAAVLPYLDYSYNNVGKEFKFGIENKGVGPAFIKDVKFIGIDSKNKDSLFFNNSYSLYDFLKQKSSIIDSIPVTKNSFNANMLISPNERKEFFAFSFNNYNQKRRFRDEYYKYYTGFRIVYEDIYGSAWILSSDKGYPEKLEKK